MEQSESIAELAAALAKAQGEMVNAPRTQVNPAFRASYADLASVWDACRQPLSKNGLAVVQTTEGMVDGNITVATTLIHSSGQWIRGHLTVPVRGRSVAQGRAEPDAQAIGSAITYARRYALAAMVGIAPEDDDGEAAKDTAPATEAPRKALAPKPTPKSPLVQAAVGMGATVEDAPDEVPLADQLKALLARHGLTPRWYATQGYKLPLSLEDAQAALATLEAMGS